MDCQSCGQENPTTNRFCGECGAALARACPACAHANPPGQKFCGACGAGLVARVERPTDRALGRKVVSIVFADLIGSTSLHERLDAESTRGLMDRYYRALQAAVEAHGGTVVKLLGDGVMAAFGVPRVAEDDAIRAVRAAVAMQHAFRQLAGDVAHEQSAGIGLRVAVNTGEVVVSADNTDVVGDPVNVAARLQQEAHDGEVLIGESTRRLVGDLVTLAPFGDLSLKGRSETVAAYRVVSLERPAGVAATAFVGRDDELRRILAVYDAAAAAPGARLAVILGSPGLGKSRLLDELTCRLGDGATVLAAQCEAAGGATFAPLAKGLRTLLRSEEVSPPRAGEGREGAAASEPNPRRGAPSETGASHAFALPAAFDEVLSSGAAEGPRIAIGISALLSGTPASPEETFFVVRRFLAALAARQPVVFVIDDLQWAEPLLLDLVEHLVQWSTGVPLFVLVAARPELRDTRSSLAAVGGLVHEVVTLAGLDAGAATRLAANVIGASELPAAVAGRVLAASEGNPLFVGELVRMLVHDGVLERQGDRWTIGVELAGLEMPPTIHALLAARIERLRAEERLVLERAAVVGRQFSRAAVAHLLPGEAQTDLDARLEALRRAEIIEPDAAWFLGEPGLRFHHGLIRDAAYRRILKGTRAELHGRFADWIEGKVGDAIEHDETIGWHLEQAHQNLRELGPIDAQGRAMGERAARHLGAAGRRALGRDDLLPAANLLGRAVDRLDAADLARADLAIDWCEALLAAGEVGPAAKAIDELARFAGEGAGGRGPGAGTEEKEGVGGQGSGVSKKEGSSPAPGPRPPTPGPPGGGASRLRAWHTCFTGQLAVLTDPQSLRATADAVAAAADELAAAGDTAGEAKALLVHALALARLGKVGACEAALDRALTAARRAGDRRRSNTVLANAPLAALWGPSPVTRASGRCLDVVRVLRITQGAPAVEAVALRCQAVLEALRGRTEAARRMIASSRGMVEELGITHRLLEADEFAGRIELLEGDAAAAEPFLRTAFDGLRGLGLGIDAARAAALLGRALLAQDRAAEAEALSHDSESLAGDDLQAAIAWRGVRAEALARRGEHAEAVELASAAVAIAAATDVVLDHADARLALAAALRASGRSDDAAAEEARAIELWEAKGATLLAERARGDASRVNQVHRAAEQPGEPAPAVRRRVGANAATANAARLDAVIAAGDSDAYGTLFANVLEAVHHPTGAVYDRRGALANWRSMMKAEDLTLANEPLATLGDSLALSRLSVTASGTSGGKFDVGAYDKDEITLIEVDAHGRRRRNEFFAADRLSNAIVRLYDRYADLLPDGPERARAAATAASIAALLGPFDVDRWATAVVPDLDFADHRHVGLESSRGAEAWLRGLRSLHEVAEDLANRVEEILDLRADALLLLWTNFGTDRAGGGAYERQFLWLGFFGTDGLMTRIELFEVDHADAALACFDEIAPSTDPGERRSAAHGDAEHRPGEPSARVWRGAPRSSGPRSTVPDYPAPHRRVRENAATASSARLDAVLAAGDVGALPDLFADDVKVVDELTGATYDRRGVLTTFRGLLRAEDASYRTEPLASLGNSLALCRSKMSASGKAGRTFDVGAYESERFIVVEVDAQGRRRRREAFALERLGDAIVRLYERCADLLPDGPERARAAATARSISAMQGRLDPDRFATAFASDVEYADRRLMGAGPARGAERLLRGLRTMLELSPDASYRVADILVLQFDALLAGWTSVGTERASGGAYERPFLMLCVFGADGFVTHMEQFDADREDEALARFDELVPGTGEAAAPAPSTTARFANAAALTVENFWDAVGRRDWDGLVAALAPDCVLDDRRSLVRTRVEGEAYFAHVRMLFHAFQECSFHLVGTRGERLALHRQRISAVSRDGGPAEFEMINLVEVNPAGRRVAVLAFDPDDLDAAYTELDARYDAHQTAPHNRPWAWMRAFERVFARRDWDAMTAMCSPALVAQNHRLVGWGTTHGAAEWVQTLRALVDLAPDARLRIDHLRASDRGAIFENAWLGTRDGGAFESLFVSVIEVDELDKLLRLDLHDPGQLDQAQARFAELILGPAKGLSRVEGLRPDLLRIPPNAATRAGDLWQERGESGDWEALRALYAPAFVMDDRRRLIRLTYDRDAAVASTQFMFRPQTSLSRRVLATAGDHLALEHYSFTGTETESSLGTSFEIDTLAVTEVDAGGCIVAIVLFDVDDRRAASAEMRERHFRLNTTRGFPAARVEFMRGVYDHDLERCRAALPEGFVFHDHRRIGSGRLEADQYITWLAALFEQSPDALIEPLYFLADEKHGALAVAHTFGTLTEGGEFESVFVQVAGPGGGELFDLEDLDRARARFEELRPDPMRIPPNAATRARDCISRAALARDWAGLRALAGDDFAFEDRGRRAQVSGGIEMWVASLDFTVSAPGHRAELELIGTVGDRILVERFVRTGDHDGGAFEIEGLRLLEVDAEGLVRAAILFDPDDRVAALSEAHERFLVGEAAAVEGQAPIQALWTAWTRRDWVAVREVLTEDAVIHDHRTLGMGRLGRDEWIESWRVGVDLAADARGETIRILAWNRHGRVYLCRVYGTAHDGGAFENIFLTVAVTDGDRVRNNEFFDAGDADEALARFEDLCSHLE